MKYILLSPRVVNEGVSQTATVVIENDRIASIHPGVTDPQDLPLEHLSSYELIDGRGLWLLPGCIDDQVHFREPGLTHKATIATESRAAVAGGVTSFMDMPNTNPPTISMDRLMEKRDIAAQTAWANYAFFVGGTNQNSRDICRIDPHLTPGIKLFLGSSTGNMLVDDGCSLDRIFAESPMVIATHCESEALIRENKARFQKLYPEGEVPIACHPEIRSREACYRSTCEAIERAVKWNSRLHVLHLSTEKEAQLFEIRPLQEKRITAEVCVHHLWFSDADYEKYGSRIKWNPAVKSEQDRDGLRSALWQGRIDVVATDHAPHLLSEKTGGALHAASGGPLHPYSLLAMIELMQRFGSGTLEGIVSKMAHTPALLFGVQDRGFIRPGYYADLVLVDPHTPTRAEDASVVSLCSWTPFAGTTFSASIHTTFVNGEKVYHKGTFAERRPEVQPLVCNAL